jgi:hypothetical protein
MHPENFRTGGWSFSARAARAARRRAKRQRRSGGARAGEEAPCDERATGGDGCARLLLEAGRLAPARLITNRRAKAKSDWHLRCPTFRDGYAPILSPDRRAHRGL